MVILKKKETPIFSHFCHLNSFNFEIILDLQESCKNIMDSPHKPLKALWYPGLNPEQKRTLVKTLLKSKQRV